MKRYVRNVLIVGAIAALVLAGSSFAISEAYRLPELIVAVSFFGILAGLVGVLGALVILSGVANEALAEWFRWIPARKFLEIRCPRSSSEWRAAEQYARIRIRERAIGFLCFCDQEAELQGQRQNESAEGIHKRILELRNLSPQLEGARILFKQSLNAAVKANLVSDLEEKSPKHWAGRK